MKKLSMLLAVLMVVTCCSVFASATAPDDDGPATCHYTFVPTNGSEEVTYLGTVTDDIPDDIFGIALNIKTDNKPFARFKVELQFDTTKLEYITCSEPKGEDLLGQYTPVEQLNYDICNDDVFIAEGKIIVTMTAHDDLTHRQGLNKVPTYEGTMIYLYFHPLTAEPCNTTINYIYTECMNETTHIYASDGESLTLKLNGGAPKASAPVVSLGAKINKLTTALRFGTQYNKMEGKAAVDELGMLLIPQRNMWENDTFADLTLDSKNPMIVNLQAKGIVEFVSGQKFDQYDKFTFYCTVINLAGHETNAIVARPYIKYTDGTVEYADAMVRSFQGVSDALDALPVA